MPPPVTITFAAGTTGPWRITRIDTIVGDSLPMADRLDVLERLELPSRTTFGRSLRGITSNTRYTNRTEVTALAAKQQGLARQEATQAALIPIRKTDEWWGLAQDERRAILEEKSRHIGIGLEYLPAIARRLHHSRELSEPFDFLTWFEFAPEHSVKFDELLQRLRATLEWRYVDREIDIRLSRV